MEKPSQRLLQDIQSSRRLFQKIITHSTELESILLSPLTFGETKEAIGQLLGKDLSIEVLYYGHNSGADIEAKACCSELAQFGSSIIDSQLTSDLKLTLFSRFNIWGFLVDRGYQNFYVSESILVAFVDRLESFIAGLHEDEQVRWTKELFQDNTNRIAEFRDRVRSASSTVERSVELDSVRNTDINDWLDDIGLVQTISSLDAATRG